MAVFNVSFLNPNLRRSSGGPSVGILSDRLAILENDLKKDGLLSAGDYDLLIAEARKIQSTAGLSASQRSDYDVRVSNYETSKSVNELNRSGDIQRITRGGQNDSAMIAKYFGNDPERYIQAKVDSLTIQLNDLSDASDRTVMAGGDNSQYLNEVNALLSEYQEQLGALEAMQQRPQGETGPVKGYVAYIKTNSKGEIVDVEYTREGNKSGFIETNGTIGGFKVYGKPNYKENGENVFLLGNDDFKGVSNFIPDPATGTFKSAPLLSSEQRVQQPNNPYTQGVSGYKEFAPRSVAIQSYVPADSWARDLDGNAYYRRQDGGYTKYVNINQSMEGRPDPKDMLRLPDEMARSLGQVSDETVDESAPFMPDTGSMAPVDLNPSVGGSEAEQAVPEISAGPMSVAPNMSTERTSQVRRTSQQPRQQSSQGLASTAQRTLRAGADFLKNVISRGV